MSRTATTLVGWPQIEGYISRGRAERLEAHGLLRIGTDVRDRRTIELADLEQAFSIQRAAVKAAQRQRLLERGGRPLDVCMRALTEERTQTLARGQGPFGLPAAAGDEEEGDK